MYHRLWVIGNSLIIVISLLYIWVFRPHDSSLVVAAQLLAQAGLILFLINVNMYFIFLVIRKTKVRQVKIGLAKFSRYFMKWHIPIAIVATTIIIGHASINLFEIGPLIGFGSIKLASGYMAVGLLALTLFAGYLRRKKASGFRRKFHLVSAMTFTCAFMIHMFLPV